MHFSRYLFALSAPVLVGISIYFGGWLSITAPVVVFGFFPLLDLALPASRKNLSPEQES